MAVQHTLDGLKQLLAEVGLAKVSTGVLLNDLHRIVIRSIAGSNDNLDVRIDFKEFLQTLGAPHSRHYQIQQNQVDSFHFLTIKRQGTLSVGGSQDFIAFLFKASFGISANREIVINQQNGLISTQVCFFF